MASPAADTRAGFTLVELLVAIVIGGLVTGSIFQLLGGQGRFVERQSAREEVQQNTRASLDLIGSELRTLPAGDALVRADADSITFRTPRVWGAVCAVTGATTLDVAVPAIAAANYGLTAGTGVVVNVGTSAAPLWTAPVGVTVLGPAASTCNGSALPAGVERRSLTLSAQPSSGATTPAVGHNLYLYDQVTYRTGTSTSVPGLWVQRRLGDGMSAVNQPLAGPVEAGTGLRFAYFTDASSAPLSTPIASAATRQAVSRVQVIVRSISRHEVADGPESKADTVVISLRNRI